MLQPISTATITLNYILYERCSGAAQVCYRTFKKNLFGSGKAGKRLGERASRFLSEVGEKEQKYGGNLPQFKILYG
jgi:hypothetical protein